MTIKRVTKADVFDREELPCGCVIGKMMDGDKKVFVIEPCNLQCRYYKYALQQSQQQHKTPTEFQWHNERTL